MRPPPELKQRVLARVRQLPSPARREANLRRRAFVAAGLLMPLLCFLLLGGTRPGERPLSLVIETALGALVLAVSSLWIVLGGGRMLGRSRAALLSVVAFLAGLVARLEAVVRLCRACPGSAARLALASRRVVLRAHDAARLMAAVCARFESPTQRPHAPPQPGRRARRRGRQLCRAARRSVVSGWLPVARAAGPRSADHPDRRGGPSCRAFCARFAQRRVAAPGAGAAFFS